MNISLNMDLSYPTMEKATRGPTPTGFDDCVRNIREEEEKNQKDNQAASGWVPGGQSIEEQHRIEMLKNKAMQIASQAEDGLTPGQESQIKDIEKEIGKILNLPMSEDLTEKAKHVAEQSQLEQDLRAKDEDQLQSQVDNIQGEEGGTSLFRTGAGMGMLHQNALVTAIKGMSATSTALKG